MARKAKARHILVKTEKACDDLKTQIAGGSDFAELAKKHSQCPSSREGGNLGEFGPGQMVPEFDKVVFAHPSARCKGRSKPSLAGTWWKSPAGRTDGRKKRTTDAHG